jgi:hypothetical protein
MSDGASSGSPLDVKQYEDATDDDRGADFVTVDVVGCARCDNGRHPALTFRRLTRPVRCGSQTMQYWALCPTNGEPILMWAKRPDGTEEAPSPEST